MSRRRVAALDVLGEVRRAMRILRRVERYLVQQERAEKRAGEKRKAKFDRARAALSSGRARTVDEALELGEQA
jgi:hypothetical protein